VSTAGRPDTPNPLAARPLRKCDAGADWRSHPRVSGRVPSVHWARSFRPERPVGPLCNDDRFARNQPCPDLFRLRAYHREGGSISPPWQLTVSNGLQTLGARWAAGRGMQVCAAASTGR
jgi:hypothetical protein